MNRSNYTGKGGNWQQRNNRPSVRGKRKWVHEQKFFEGSLSEGQGFAFKRKQKVQYEYNKLLTKERRKQLNKSNPQYRDEYPEHLRHLYMAENEKLKNEDLANRSKRSIHRMVERSDKSSESTEVNDADTDQATITETIAVTVGTEQLENADDKPEPTVEKESEKMESPEQAKPSHSIPMSNRLKKKLTRKTSYQIAQEEFQKVCEKRRKKKEEFQRNKQQQEKAIQRYKNKKKETFQVLSKKTKKGQPNLNLQMEHLLQKIQGAGK